MPYTDAKSKEKVMERTTDRLARCAHIARSTFPGVLLALGLSSCDRDAPTAAGRSALARDSAWVVDLAGLAVALQDVRSRILPALGNGPALEALGSTLTDLERTLSVPEAATLTSALGRANAAALHVPVNTALLPDRDVVLLVLEQIDAVAHGPAEGNRREP